MNILGIGPLELFFILLLALLIFGPKDLEKTGKSIAQSMLKIVRSDTWKTVSQVSRKIKNLPNEMMREAGMEELKQSIAPLAGDLKKLNQPELKPGTEPLPAPPGEETGSVKPASPTIPPVEKKPPEPPNSREEPSG
jgi:Sec-independent protein translocase protein TatA